MLFHTEKNDSLILAYKLRISIYRRTTIWLDLILPLNVSLLRVNLCASVETRGLCESSVLLNIISVFKKTHNEIYALSSKTMFKFSNFYLF